MVTSQTRQRYGMAPVPLLSRSGFKIHGTYWLSFAVRARTFSTGQHGYLFSYKAWGLNINAVGNIASVV